MALIIMLTYSFLKSRFLYSIYHIAFIYFLYLISISHEIEIVLIRAAQFLIISFKKLSIFFSLDFAVYKMIFFIKFKINKTENCMAKNSCV